MGSWCRCWKQLALTLSIAQAADWIAWKNDQRQGQCVCGCAVWEEKDMDQSYQRMDGWCFGELGMLSGF